MIWNLIKFYVSAIIQVRSWKIETSKFTEKLFKVPNRCTPSWITLCTRKNYSRMCTVCCSDRRGGCTCPGGVPAWGVYLSRRCTCPGGVPAGGVPDRGAPAQGGCTCLGVYPSMHPGKTPPMNRMTDRRLWKYYLAATSLRTVKISFRGFIPSHFPQNKATTFASY